MNKINIKRFKLSNEGFTLVEILAAIVILSIAITFILPIFPKLLNWSNESESELVASNLLSRVADDIKEDNKILTFVKTPAIGIPSCTLNPSDPPKYISIPKGTSVEVDKYILNGKIFNVDMFICQSDKENKLNLVRVKIDISNEGRTISSYTYLKKVVSGG